jgi:hypothetical protein
MNNDGANKARKDIFGHEWNEKTSDDSLFDLLVICYQIFILLILWRL